MDIWQVNHITYIWDLIKAYSLKCWSLAPRNNFVFWVVVFGDKIWFLTALNQSYRPIEVLGWCPLINHNIVEKIRMTLISFNRKPSGFLSWLLNFICCIDILMPVFWINFIKFTICEKFATQGKRQFDNSDISLEKHLLSFSEVRLL